MTRPQAAPLRLRPCACVEAIVAVAAAGAAQAAPVSINSTSQNFGDVPSSPVIQQPAPRSANSLRPVSGSGRAGYQILGGNDLGMHCGDLDTRVSSILPPFNVIHAVVLKKGEEPRILGPTDVDVVYTAASSASDEVNARPAPYPFVFKTNFWDTVTKGSYDPFYPPSVTPLGTKVGPDVGLPVPDVAELYLGSGALVADQQKMPGVNAPYSTASGGNAPQAFSRFDTDLPFFTNPAFKFGYTLTGLNWFAADGIPITTFDDAGRTNPYPLVRAQAKARSGNRLGVAAGTVLATTDMVVPVSGEADCKGCHAATQDGGNGSAISGIQVAVSTEDPQHGRVPNDVSVEWATDWNVLRLHDKNEGTQLVAQVQGGKPVVCQTCHYTPALDLAQVGPKGPENDPANANGRDQVKNQSMSRVIHHYHGLKSASLATTMPPPVANGVKRDPVAAAAILEKTCYSCHPGKNTKCLRGAMGGAGVVCQDCHGNMAQVGNDFSRDVSPSNPGAFILAADFYTNPNTPRVPWANEPGCGSCHTGDATSNLASAANVLKNPKDSYGNIDNIRLAQAFRVGDAKATPIVPTNKRFAEDTVTTTAGTRNPALYRFSTGHGDLFCEACHGSTHAEWPNKNPLANDNVTAKQLQGHVGTIVECNTCHTGTIKPGLNGPHGMHPVDGNWVHKHEDFAEHNLSSCKTCHGADLKGTVLSRALAKRTFTNVEDVGTVTFKLNQPVGCGHCHSNPAGSGG